MSSLDLSLQEKSPLLLGVADGVIRTELSDYTVSHLGGKPVWPDKLATVECKTCTRVMVLVSQVYCPLTDTPYHRVLFVYACLYCSNSHYMSWRVFRIQRFDDTFFDLDPALPPLPAKGRLDIAAVIDWGAAAIDWGAGAVEFGDASSSEPCAAAIDTEVRSLPPPLGTNTQKYAQAVKKNLDLSSPEAGSREGQSVDVDEEVNKLQQQLASVVVKESSNDTSMETVATCSDKDEGFVGYYISVVDEADVVDIEDDVHVTDLLLQYCEQDDDGFDPSGNWDDGDKPPELYEKADVRHGDHVFYRFTKKVALCPEQVLRYHRKGEPLLISSKQDSFSVPSCHWCGAKMCFEMQFMPQLIQVLKLPVDFGTVLIYTCSKSCWSGTDRREEFVYVQPDPDDHLLPPL